MDKLGIQWKILVSQTISFSIVFFVLWRFAYKPIFQMLQARREKIAEARCRGPGEEVDRRRPPGGRPRAGAGDPEGHCVG
jgi:hypothetical protein